MCVCVYIYISRIQSYLLVKIAHRFLSENSQNYVDPRGVAWGPTPTSHMRHPGIRCHGDKPGSHSRFLALTAKSHLFGLDHFSIDTLNLYPFSHLILSPIAL